MPLSKDPRLSRTQKAAKKHKGLDFFEHLVTGSAKDLYHSATGLPTAAIMVGRAGYHDVRHPLARSHLAPIAGAVLKSTYGDVRHPIRTLENHPGYLLTDALAAFSAGGGLAGRGAQVSRALRATRGAKAVHRAERLNKMDAAATLRMNPKVSTEQADLMARRMGLKPEEVSRHLKKHRPYLEQHNALGVNHALDTGRGAFTSPGLSRAHALRHPAPVEGEPEGLLHAALRRPVYTRTLRAQRPIGDKIVVPASRNPLLRMLREVTAPRGARAGKELDREIFRRKQLAQDLAKAHNGEIPGQGSLFDVAPHTENPAEQAASAIGRATSLPMNVIRKSMRSAPPYYLQNLIQTAQMAAFRPGVVTRDLARVEKLRKSDPELFKLLHRGAGESVSHSIEIGANRLKSEKLSGLRKAAGKVGKTLEAPEQHIRVASIYRALKDAGVKEKDMHSVLSNHAIGNNQLYNALVRGQRSVGYYGDLNRTEQAFMKSQIPIFYPMFKALGKYPLHLANEHSIATAAMAHLGAVGSKERKRLLGDLPFWAEWLAPVDAGAGRPPERHPRVVNTGPIYFGQPAAEIGREAVESFTHRNPRPGISLLSSLLGGPLPQMGYGALTGKDLATGYPIRAPKNIPGGAVGASIYDLLGNQRLSLVGQRAFGGSATKTYVPPSFLRELAGRFGPGYSLVSRRAKREELHKQAKKEAHYGRHRKKNSNTGMG
jgi:hypothetical protein